MLLIFALLPVASSLLLSSYWGEQRSGHFIVYIDQALPSFTLVRISDVVLSTISFLAWGGRVS